MPAWLILPALPLVRFHKLILVGGSRALSSCRNTHFQQTTTTTTNQTQYSKLSSLLTKQQTTKQRSNIVQLYKIKKKSLEITVIPQINIEESFPVVKTCRREQFQQKKNTHTQSYNSQIKLTQSNRNGYTSKQQQKWKTNRQPAKN